MVDSRGPKATSLDEVLQAVFGSAHDPMNLLETRASERFPNRNVIVWEGDAATFQFTYVGRAAEVVLGYPVAMWTGNPTFWADHVVWPDDRDDAIAYCALATAKGCDHTFEYRARAVDGRLVWLRDIVQVIRGRRGVAERLRGLMFDITAEKRAANTFEMKPSEQLPPRAVLLRLPDARADQ